MKNKKPRLLSIVSILWITSTSLLCNAQTTNGNEKWDDRFALPGVSGGANPLVNAIVTDSSGNFYIGGNFSFVENIPANNIAKWDGTTWQACGNGVHGGVSSLVAIGDKIYAGGSFDSAGMIRSPGIAMWNGNAWDSLNSMGIVPFGGSLSVSCLKAYQGKLYAGGGFTVVSGPDTLYSIAVYDIASDTWSKMGRGMKYGSVSQFETIGGYVYACGNFITVDGKPIERLAKWDITTSTWSAMITQISHPFKLSYYETINSIHANGNVLYVGGSFDSINGVLANNIVKYDPTAGSWTAIGPGIPNNYLQITAIETYGTNIYIAPGIMRWDGTKWFSLANFDLHVTGQVSSVNVLYASGKHLFIGGAFSDCYLGNDYTFANEHIVSNGVCDYDLGTGHLSFYHTAKTMGLNSAGGGSISQMALSGNDIYAIGAFTHAGNVRVNGIAHWDGAKWDSLGSGAGNNTGLFGIAANSKFVYVDASDGGIPKGGMPSGLNRWDISKKTWSLVNALGSSVMLLDSKGVLYKAGIGLFYLDSATNKWISLGTSSGGINAIAMDDSDNIYCGGSMGDIDGVTVSGIAKWTRKTKTWSDMGIYLSHASNAGYPGIVNAIYINGDKIYVGGGFSYKTYNGVQSGAHNILVYNRTSNKWSDISSSLIGSVTSISGSGKTVFVGGYMPGYNIIAWDTVSKSWSYLGNGIINENTSQSSVSSLVMNQNKLYVGGAAQFAGNKPSFNFYIWDTTNAPPAAPTALALVSTHKKAANQYALQWTDNANNESGFGIERSIDNGNNWVSIAKTVANTNSFNDTGVNTATVYSYGVYAFNNAGKSAYSNTVKTDGGSSIVPNDIKTCQIQIFPNPSNGIINVLCMGSQLENGILNITNEEGVIVYNQNLVLTPGNTIQLHPKDLAIGLYIVSVETNSFSVQQKMIIQY